MSDDMGESDERMIDGSESEMDYAKLVSSARTWFPMVMSALFATMAFILFQRRAKERRNLNDVNGFVEKVNYRAGEKISCEGKSGGVCCKENGSSNLKVLYGTNRYVLFMGLSVVSYIDDLGILRTD